METRFHFRPSNGTYIFFCFEMFHSASIPGTSAYSSLFEKLPETSIARAGRLVTGPTMYEF
jgi:hypothetical protein